MQVSLFLLVTLLFISFLEHVMLSTAVLFTVPGGLKIESLGASWILISWKLNTAGESYIVSVSDGDKEENYTVNSTQDSLNITGLKGNTEYYLSVIAVAESGNISPPSAVLTAVTAIPSKFTHSSILHY